MNKEKIIKFVKGEWPELIIDGLFTYKSYELYKISEKPFEQKEEVLDNLKLNIFLVILFIFKILIPANFMRVS